MALSIDDFAFYFKLGWEHIISPDALDHQLFIAALAAVYIFKDIKQVLILVTAFTIGHSLTLVLSVLDIVRFSGKWVEFLIPCTILITATNNLSRLNHIGESEKFNYYFALGFGLVHGMGFANAIRIMLAKDQALGLGLFGFNVGLEAGQIMVTAFVLLIAKIAMDYFHILRRDWVFFLSSAVFALSLKMAFERWPH